MFKQLSQSDARTDSDNQTQERSQAESTQPSPEALEHLPEQYNGWIQLDVDLDEQEARYARKGATHVSGAYTRITIAGGTCRRTDRSRWRVIKESFDKWGDRQSSTHWDTTDSDPEEAFERAWGNATRKMDRHDPPEAFDEWPSLPDEVGNWTLETDEFKASQWVAPNGEAITVNRTDIEGRYAGHTRLYSATWTAPDDYEGAGPARVEFVTDGLHAGTVDTALAAMEANPHGLTNSDAAAVLPNLHGVGPAKTRAFQLAGIRSQSVLKDYTNETESNSTMDWPAERTKLIDKTLTSTIRDAL
jgi:hypothetical protein